VQEDKGYPWNLIHRGYWPSARRKSYNDRVHRSSTSVHGFVRRFCSKVFRNRTHSAAADCTRTRTRSGLI